MILKIKSKQGTIYPLLSEENITVESAQVTAILLSQVCRPNKVGEKLYICCNQHHKMFARER